MEPYMYRIQDYLKGELRGENADEVAREINSNDQMKVALQQEQQFTNFLRSRLQRQPASAVLAQNIRRKVSHHRLDDHEPPHLA
jgi:hypothetical protein